ncbi:hypothetical protein F2Q69_00001222 [Brassica cretica]|uniref:Uncharacterized protein n=1 Tax=Brassica cretica TaxID=69181 RepID=A0A8S9PHW5_BRACR|nr:hypothetical protein F2Q69_00001222 [Brassica cretica]
MFPRHLSLPLRERSNLSLPAAQGFGLFFLAVAASVAAAGILVLFSIYCSRRLRRLEDGLLQRCGHPDSEGVKPEIFLCALLDASSVEAREARAASISSSSVMFVLQRAWRSLVVVVQFVPPGLCGSTLVSYLWSASATSLAPGAPHPSNQNGIGGCSLLRLLLFSNNPSAWVRHLRAVNGSGLVCGVSARLRVLSVASDLFPSEGCPSFDLSSLYEFTVRWVHTVPVDCNGGGNLRRKILNDGIVGLRLLLVQPMALT